MVRVSAACWMVLLLLSAAAMGDVTAEMSAEFVRHHDGKLYEGPNEFRFISWNVPNLLVIEDAFEFLGDSPWRWPNEFELNDALESVGQMGGTVVRPYVITVQREDGDMGKHVHVLAPGVFNEQAFETLDLALAVARQKGLRLIIPFVDNWRWQGGIEQYAAFRGKQPEEFWTDEQLFDDYQRTVAFIINRRNTVTGVRYRDDPTILGWETGNELDAPPEWTAKAAAYIKQLDSNHLVIDGRSLKGITEESLQNPDIDVVTTHHYPNAGNNAEAVVAAHRQVGGRKAYFVGEFGFLDVSEAQRMIDTVIDRGISGALYWSLRFHRREGGFYWHHEPSGGDLFKAYHWPGFPEGREYREHQVIPMIRQAAFRIRGLEVPPIQVPAPPRLLPIDDVAHISWQGSAGASDYDVQRSLKPDGPWQVVGSDIRDTAVQYRPLFNDSTARVGQAYYYRVIAKNGAGASAASNIVGPVEVRYQTLVDEMRDLSQIAKVNGVHELRTNEARRVQEDIHRLALQPGTQLLYEVPGEVKSVRVWAFTHASSNDIKIVAVKPNGGATVSVPNEIQSVVRPTGDYNYLRPLLVEASQIPPGVSAVKVNRTDSSPAGELQVSRVEIRYVLRRKESE